MNPVNVDTTLTDQILRHITHHAERIPAITTIRKEALEHFQALGLPAAKHEEYKHTPFTRTLEKNIDLSSVISSDKFSGTPEDYTIPALDCYRITLINGVWSDEQSVLPTQKGVTVLPLEKALADHKESVLKHFSMHAKSAHDALVAWNTAAWQSGVYLAVDGNVVLDKPILIHHLIDGHEGQILEVSRNLIILNKSSEATVIEKFDAIGEHNHFTNIVTESIVGENAGLSYYTLQTDTPAAIHFNHTSVHQVNNSRVNAYTFTLDGKLIRNNLQLTLDGEGCESHMYGLYLLKQNTIADNHTVADHQKPNSFSNELYKGIMDENSKGVFNGKIFVRPNAQKTNAFQSNRNILLSDNATINTKPQLEIWADDVKCSHGCTSGQLDEEALFYLQTRGIEKKAAQAMLLQAFAGEVLDAVPLPAIHDFLNTAVTERLFGTR